MNTDSEISKIRKAIRNFKAQDGLDWSEEDLAGTLHIINRHKIDHDAALDQTSHGPNDHGIDAWVISPAGDTLWIYQSKLTENKNLVLNGLNNLLSACTWVENALIKDKNEQPCPPILFNLANAISREAGNLKTIHFVLISPFDGEIIESSMDFTNCLKKFGKTNLNRFLVGRKGQLEVSSEKYDIKRGVMSHFKKYEVEKIRESRITLRDGAHLGISYIPLINLVRLYRQRGDVLFDKNVRLSLNSFQQSRNRVFHPMEETLDSICEGHLEPEIFPFYHVGITLSANVESERENGISELEGPSVVNGCQTITIANHFYEKLEKEKDKKKLERFSKINVIAKIVIGTNGEELREITNCNNRQNPIDNWQLFSNDDFQIRIEMELGDLGIFYERQKGKLATLNKKASFAEDFPNTNNTGITIPILAQVLCYFQNRIQWAAKPSEVFEKEENYRLVFNESVIQNKEHIVFAVNLWRSAASALRGYQYDNEQYSQNPFKLPIIRTHLQQLAIAFVWQKKYKLIDDKYKVKLNKAAPPSLVDLCYDFYPKVLAKTKRFYKDFDDGQKDIGLSKREKFFHGLAIELGIDPNKLPFS